ncbi:FUSC family protein [Paraburkholderia panacisoli]|uniref:FUSC family protein n=1 Tax=Paraburkholderia panacisoli TaxID=2603818 RepID=A0A5B0GNR7_9BURK|nr:FUSC family protein [Paraburkholderia panacisoli]KAA1004862.1 FUSC family protein [Paraburkholderia panacisoli]
MFTLLREKAFYSLRLYISAIMALGIAFWQDFGYPYWSMTIVYVLIQPSGGQTRLKAGHLLIGALAGAVVGVISAAVFSTSQAAQLVAMTLFVMATSLGSFRERRPRYYAYMLSGVTCLLVAMPGIATPDVAFDRAVGRVQDALLAVFAYLIVDAMLFPRGQSSNVMAVAEQWLTDLRAATVGALRAKSDDPRIRSGIVQRAIQLVPLTDGASQEGLTNAWRYRVLVAVLERGMRILPVLSTFADLERAIGASARFPKNLALREDLARWIEADCPDDTRSDELQRRLRIRPAWSAPYDIDAAFELCYLRYLRAIYTGWRRIQHDYQLKESDSEAIRRLRHEGRPMPATIGQVDINFAIRGVLSIGLYAFLMGILWNATGWNASTMALSMLMGIAFCVTSGMADDPVMALVNPAKISGIAMITVGFYIQIVFPLINDFWELALALFPALFMLGLVVQQQGGVLFAILPMALLRIGNGQAGISIDGLLNSIIGLYIGIGVAVIAKTLIQRPAFVDVVRGLLCRNRNQLRDIVDIPLAGDIKRFSLDVLDRFAFLESRATKLVTAMPTVQASAQMLRELQIGRSVHVLHRWAGASSNRSSVFEPIRCMLANSLTSKMDPLRPWVTNSLSSLVDATLHTLLGSNTCDAATARALIELRVALEEIKQPRVTANPVHP